MIKKGISEVLGRAVISLYTGVMQKWKIAKKLWEEFDTIIELNHGPVLSSPSHTTTPDVGTRGIKDSPLHKIKNEDDLLCIISTNN